MGLLDGLFSDDPQKQAQLAMALGLLGGQGGKGFGGFMRDLGQAGMQGMNRYALANEDKRRNELARSQAEMANMQREQMKASLDEQAKVRALAPQFFAPGNSPADGMGPSAPPKADWAGYGHALAQIDPTKAIGIQQAMMKDNAFGKVDPKDYTPESIQKFAQTGMRDYSVLVPVRKMEVSQGAVYDPFSAKPGSFVTGPQSDVVPDGRGGFTYNTAKISPVELARLGNENTRTRIDVARAADEGIGGVGLSPKGQREIQQKVGEKGALDLRQAQSDLPGIAAEAQQTIGLVNKLLEHPGLPDAVGLKGKGGIPTAVGLPPIPATNAADFTALKDQLLGKQFLQAFQTLKGGGQITEVEGKKATDAMARMNTAQSEKAFREAADEFRGVIATGLARAQGKAGAAPTPTFNGLSVTLPDGQTLRFPSESALRAFRKQAGI